MEMKIITRVNNVEIVAGNDEKKLVPIRPICDALGISYQPQIAKLKEHKILSSVVTLSVTTGADKKQYEMSCLPLEFVFGWLFTINASNVKEEARESVLNYQMECYQALFRYFTEPQIFLQEKQKLIEEKKEVYKECKRNFKDAEKLMRESMKTLDKIIHVSIDEWRDNNRQLGFVFE